MAHRLSDTYQVPVAVLDERGTRQAQSRSSSATTPARATSPPTTVACGNVWWPPGWSGGSGPWLWFQGESDDNDAARHVAGFTALLGDWRREIGTDIPGGSRYYVFQVRTSPCGDSGTGQLREAQRRMRGAPLA